MRAAREDTLVRKDTAVNAVDDTCAGDTQNISSASEPAAFRERTATQTSLKRKKKSSDNGGTDDETSDIQCKTQDLLPFIYITSSFSCALSRKLRYLSSTSLTFAIIFEFFRFHK